MLLGLDASVWKLLLVVLLVPIIAVWLWGLADGSPVFVGVYLTGAAVLTLIALILAPETKNIDMEA